jgi:hypothetical protein
MPYITRQPVGDCGCGCKGAPASKGGCGMGADASGDPIQNITGVAPGTPISSGTSVSGLLPYVAAGGLLWFLFLRKKGRR